jgi:hypothetical protein
MSRKSTKKASPGRPAAEGSDPPGGAGHQGPFVSPTTMPRRATKTVRRLKKVKDLRAKAVKAAQDRNVKGGAVYQHHQTDLEFLR